MAVVVYSHEPEARSHATAADVVRRALRTDADALSDADAAQLDASAFDMIETHTGLLIESRSTVLLLEVVGRAEVVDPAGWWRPRPSAVSSVESWSASGWSTATVAAEDPLGRYRLGAGWWRLTTTAGLSAAEYAARPALAEAWARIMGYLFESDPAAPPSRLGVQAGIIRLCGAVELLKPFCVRRADVLEPG